MNFVGHIHIALFETAPSDAFLVGSMLPDFASMARVRLSTASGDLAEGIAHHHRTDERFHGAPDFIRLCAEIARELEAAGVPWGGARAVAHVGIEMLLDGDLLDETGTLDAYRRAARRLLDPEVRSLARTADAPRFEQLLVRLESYGPPLFYRDPALVAERLIRMLESRPRLAIPSAVHGEVERVLARRSADVHAVAPALVAAARG